MHRDTREVVMKHAFKHATLSALRRTLSPISEPMRKRSGAWRVGWGRGGGGGWCHRHVETINMSWDALSIKTGRSSVVRVLKVLLFWRCVCCSLTGEEGDWVGVGVGGGEQRQ